MNSARSLKVYLNSFSPPEPVSGSEASWWRGRVLDAASGADEPDRDYWLIVWTGLLVKWAAASQRQWRSPEALVIDGLMNGVEAILWPEKKP